MENKMCAVPSGPQLLLVEEGMGLFSTVLHYEDGTEKRLPATMSAKDLIAATEIDYGGYRREIKRLRDEHPLFQARLDVSVADFEDLVAEALLLPSMLQKTDPVSFFVLGELLHARLARMEYLDGKLTAEDFLRRIDTTHELNSYEADRAELVGETVWQNRVAGDFSFDPETYYPEAMQVLDLGAVEPQWELRTVDDLGKEDQKGHQSLREKYGKG